MVMDNVEIEGFFHDLSLLLRDAENRNAGTDLLILKEKCQQSIRTLHFIREDRNVDPPNLDEIIQNVNIIYQEIDRALLCPNQRGIASLAVFSSGPVAGNSNGNVGRPKFEIDGDTLVNLKTLGFTWSNIAKLLCVSTTTLWRRVRELDLKQCTGFTDISNEDLDLRVQECRNLHGITCGRSMVTGFLLGLGIRVQQRRVTESLVRVDPGSSRLRWASVIRRRKYQVRGPNSLWHCDGHHITDQSSLRGEPIGGKRLLRGRIFPGPDIIRTVIFR